MRKNTLRKNTVRPNKMRHGNLRRSRLPFSALALLVVGGIITVGDVFFDSSSSSASLPSVDAQNVLVGSTVGMAQFVLLVGLWWAALSCLIAIVAGRKRADATRRALFLAPLSLAMLLLAMNQTFSSGRALLAVGFLMPGSALTHLILWTTASWLHRALEPAWLLLLFSLLLLGRPFRTALWSFVGLWLFECLVLMFLAPAGLTLSGAIRVLSWFHYFAAIGSLAGVITGVRALSQQDLLELTPGLVRRCAMPFGGALVLVLVVLGMISFGVPRRGIELGAHYYSWFPENWSHGYAGDKTLPKIQPLLGEYTLRDSSTFLQHQWWAREAKLGYFILDWWPTRARLQRRIKDYLGAAATELDPVKIALQYELLDLRQVDKRAIPGEPSYVVTLTPARVEKLRDDLVMLARDFMTQPYYLRINQRPMVFLYATRHALGDVSGALAFVRDEVRRETGLELFLVADEAFYQVLFSPESDSKINHKINNGHRLGAVGEVNWSRLQAFDAITSYNPYDTSRPLYGGEEGSKLFLRDVQEMYRHWAKVAASANLLFVPTAIPGYNDRGVRLAADHYVVPRRTETQWFLNQSFEAWVRPFLDPREPLAAITSWNEWNEGSAIEPTNTTEPTTEDDGPSGHDYTDEQFQEGYGCQYLELVSDFVNSF